jgi:Tol biopolymer transport system component
VVSLLACDGTRAWLRGSAPATAYAAPLASDTSVLTTRRVWSSSNIGSNILLLATIMPNGAGLATVDWETGDPAVFDLASGEYRRFRFNSAPYDTTVALTAVPSPDGSKLAVYHWMLTLEPRIQLRIHDVGSGEARTIMTADTTIAESLWPLAWTPAGDSVFASLHSSHSQGGDVQVLLIPAAGGAPRLVHTISSRARPWRMSLSPDGRWLLYDHELSRGLDIDIIDVQGGGARKLVERPGLDRLVGWLPGTDVVLFSSDRSGTTDLWSVRVANGRASAEPRRVRSGFFRSEAVGFGDGALFYRVETGSRGPSVINVDPGSGALLGPASPLLPNLNSAFFRFMGWSPDGQTLAAALTLERGSGTINLHSMETGESHEFWLDAGVRVQALEWAADGKALFLRAGEAGSPPEGPHHFLRLDLVTGTSTRLFEAADPEETPHYWRFLATPDGRSIVLRQQRTLDDGRIETKLVLRSLEDGSERQLHRTSGFIPELSISADGTHLAFVQQVWEDSDSLFVIRLDGSQPLRAVANWDYDVVSLLGWLPAGSALLAARLTEDEAGEEILRIELDGSATVVGISPFRPHRGARGVQGFHRSRLVFSPAGNRLVHSVHGTGEELWRMDGLHQVFAEDAAGRR